MNRQELINHIITMKNGNKNCTPQPDYARDALAYYNRMLPEMKLNDGVRDAMKEST